MSNKHIGLGQPTYDYILSMIMTKKLTPGDKIPELKIAQEFGISRTPVRDAMRQLSNEGLIEIHPNRFAQVAQYSEEEIQNIGVLRIALDSMAIHLSSLYGSQADFLRLKQIAQSCYEAFKAGNGTLRRQYDCDFHMELARISGNSLLTKFQNELYMRVQFIILNYPTSIENENRHIDQHFLIADALMSHDVQACLEMIIDHHTSFYNLGKKFPPDFFQRMF